jgi:hypothetical protein
VPGTGCDHRCRHLRGWLERVRGERAEFFHRPTGGGPERIVGPGRGVADGRVHEYTRVIPDASKLADTQAFRGR